ncbi:hypothetical protein V1478_013813 [Vespula squamosa]|uniref:Uncharacterized protein n=1 Tax=Vespula squamosa TaxID=30214 RepID=A0ABD2A741_VESSQ
MNTNFSINEEKHGSTKVSTILREEEYIKLPSNGATPNCETFKTSMAFASIITVILYKQPSLLLYNWNVKSLKSNNKRKTFLRVLCLMLRINTVDRINDLRSITPFI